MAEGYALVEASVLEGKSVLSRSVFASPLRVQPLPVAAASRAASPVGYCGICVIFGMDNLTQSVPSLSLKRGLSRSPRGL